MIDASIGGVMLAVDEEAMLVALRNLVENAAIYGPEGQRVTASFALTGGEARVMIDDQDRQSVVSGKSVSVRVDLGGRRIITTKIPQSLPPSVPDTPTTCNKIINLITSKTLRYAR